MSGRFTPPEWGIALSNLQFPMNCAHATFSLKSPERARNRNSLVQFARNLNTEFILFLDDDTVPPAETPRLLLQRQVPGSSRPSMIERVPT